MWIKLLIFFIKVFGSRRIGLRKDYNYRKANKLDELMLQYEKIYVYKQYTYIESRAIRMEARSGYLRVLDNLSKQHVCRDDSSSRDENYCGSTVFEYTNEVGHRKQKLLSRYKLKKGK